MKVGHYMLGWLLICFGSAAAALDEQDLLRPEQAFALAYAVMDPQRVEVRWDVAPGYYLYDSKLRFLSRSPDIDLGEPQRPQAEIKQDKLFGEVGVHRGQVRVGLPVRRASTGTADLLRLQVSYQGCADAGLCYPPQKQELLIELPALAARPPDPEASAAAAALAPLPVAPTRSASLAALAGLAAAPGGEPQESYNPGLEEDFLEPEDAFGFFAEVTDPNRLRLTWMIAEGTYLYRDEMRLSLPSATTERLGDYQWPPGEIKKDSVLPDGNIGDVAVYHGEVVLEVPLLRSSAQANDLLLRVDYQGCAERGICYPPISREVTLALPPTEQLVSAEDMRQLAAAAPAEPVARAEQDEIAATLKSGNAWLILVTFFGFGLLLSLTPCVFPMIPILSGIIAGHGQHITPGKAFVLSLVYVLAMAVTYTVAGVLAGLFGENLQAAFQDPWILGGFALVFVLLALSMFGFYELQLPSSWQSRLAEASNRQKGGSLTGVAVMGFLSALIVGPCVAPPLAGALIYIGQTGDALLGGMALFFLSLGMGVPLIAIGTSAGKFLPRAGVWMNAVKAVFGVLLLAVAIVLLERIVPPAVAMLLWGMLMMVSAVYMGALEALPSAAGGWRRLWKGLGLVLLVYGGLMLLGVAAGGKDTVQPLRGVIPAAGNGAHGGLEFQRIKTVADLQARLKQSAGKPVMLDFYADWCVSCKEMERYTFSDAEVIRALQGVTLLQADVTENDEQDEALLQGHVGLPGPPAILFYGADGRERRELRVVGFMPADEFLRRIQAAKQP